MMSSVAVGGVVGEGAIVFRCPAQGVTIARGAPAENMGDIGGARF
jgi:hypothetical protein